VLARQRSIFVIVIGLLVWLILAYSEVVLMVIATVFVVSGLSLHLFRTVRHYLISHPAKT
jgi:hypothetical protein